MTLARGLLSTCYPDESRLRACDVLQVVYCGCPIAPVVVMSRKTDAVSPPGRVSLQRRLAGLPPGLASHRSYCLSIPQQSRPPPPPCSHQGRRVLLARVAVNSWTASLVVCSSAALFLEWSCLDSGTSTGRHSGWGVRMGAAWLAPAGLPRPRSAGGSTRTQSARTMSSALGRVAGGGRGEIARDT